MAVKGCLGVLEHLLRPIRAQQCPDDVGVEIVVLDVRLRRAARREPRDRRPVSGLGRVSLECGEDRSRQGQPGHPAEDVGVQSTEPGSDRGHATGAILGEDGPDEEVFETIQVTCLEGVRNGLLGPALVLEPAGGPVMQCRRIGIRVAQLPTEQVAEQAVTAEPRVLAVDGADEQVLLRDPMQSLARLGQARDRLGQRSTHLVHDRRPDQQVAISGVGIRKDLGVEIGPNQSVVARHQGGRTLPGMAPQGQPAEVHARRPALRTGQDLVDELVVGGDAQAPQEATALVPRQAQVGVIDRDQGSVQRPARHGQPGIEPLRKGDRPTRGQVVRDRHEDVERPKVRGETVDIIDDDECDLRLGGHRLRQARLVAEGFARAEALHDPGDRPARHRYGDRSRDIRHEPHGIGVVDTDLDPRHGTHVVGRPLIEERRLAAPRRRGQEHQGRGCGSSKPTQEFLSAHGRRTRWLERLRFGEHVGRGHTPGAGACAMTMWAASLRDAMRPDATSRSASPSILSPAWTCSVVQPRVA